MKGAKIINTRGNMSGVMMIRTNNVGAIKLFEDTVRIYDISGKQKNRHGSVRDHRLEGEHLPPQYHGQSAPRRVES